MRKTKFKGRRQFGARLSPRTLERRPNWRKWHQDLVDRWGGFMSEDSASAGMPTKMKMAVVREASSRGISQAELIRRALANYGVR